MRNTLNNSLDSEPAVDDLLSFSIQNSNKKFAVFKHSTRCNISAMALNRMQNTSFFEKFDVPFYYLDLIQHRNVSNYIAQKFQVEHESPQILIIQNGKCIASQTHNGIRESWLMELLPQANS
jgi:bacillithiol system protein YtxJ